MAKGKAKIPKHAVPISDRPGKQPQTSASVSDRQGKQPHSMNSATGDHFAWRFSRADRGGPFAWTALEDPTEYKSVMERLHHFESMKQHQLQESGSHPIPVSSLSAEAKKRLTEIQQDDLDELMSFRINGPTRVFCVRERNVMRVLWYDPEHKVCLSKLKHT